MNCCQHKSIIALVLILFSFNLLAASSNQVGRIIKLTGDVKVYGNPGMKAQGPSPRALFEGTYYTVKKARLGMKINNGFIVETGNKSKARIVFKNGDQYNIGEGTAYRVSWASKGTKKKKDGSVINLMRGKFRAIVSKKGPRSKLKVNTRYAAMGVRGTDFFVSKRGNVGETKLSVLRGEVSFKVKPPAPKVKTKETMKVAKEIMKAEPIKVTSGFSASVKVPEEAEIKKVVTKTVDKGAIDKEVVEKELYKPKKDEIQLTVEKTNKQELKVIQKASVIKVKPEEKQKITKKLAKEFEKLEKKAFETTLEDIKQYDKKLYEDAKKMKKKSVAALNTAVVKKVAEKAPEAPAKPDEDDFDDIQEDVYERYYIVE